MDEYVVGSRKKLEMAITVKNRGEDSYETMFYMRMPYDVQYIRTNKSAHNVSLTKMKIKKQFFYIKYFFTA